MWILGYLRRRTDVHVVAQELRNSGIQVSGPYRTRKGLFMFSIADCVVTADEILDLGNSGKLNAERVQEFLRTWRSIGQNGDESPPSPRFRP
jgi:hypothetical protein